MKIYKSFLIVLLATGAVFASVNSVFAAVRCETQYGGGQVCVTTGNLQINKQVCHTEKGDDGFYKECVVDKDSFVDNLFLDHKFSTSDKVTFKLFVKNVGDNTLTNVKVIDTLPEYFFLTGETAREFTIDKLNPGDSKDLFVKTRVVAESQLPSESCVVNTAEANSSENEHDKDMAQVCVGKKVLGITSLPKTGPSDTFLILSLSAITGLAGIALIRLAKAK